MRIKNIIILITASTRGSSTSLVPIILARRRRRRLLPSGRKNSFQRKINMETRILKVVRQGEAFSVQSSKNEAGSIQKCNIVLKELGGKFENEYVCAMLGNLAACRFYEGDVVMATLRFSTHEYQGQVFQEILVTEIVKLN